MHKETIEDLVKESPCKGNGWCFFRELVSSFGMDDRMAEQSRLIYDYKFLESQRVGYDIGIKRAAMEFIERGYAEKYAKVWHDGMTHDELKYAVFI